MGLEVVFVFFWVSIFKFFCIWNNFVCLIKIFRLRIFCECIDFNCVYFWVKIYKIKYKWKFVFFFYDWFGLRLFLCGIFKMFNFWLNCKIYCNCVLFYLFIIGNGKFIVILVFLLNVVCSILFYDFFKWRVGFWCNNKFSWFLLVIIVLYFWFLNWILVFFDWERINVFGKLRR